MVILRSTLWFPMIHLYANNTVLNITIYSEPELAERQLQAGEYSYNPVSDTHLTVPQIWSV